MKLTWAPRCWPDTANWLYCAFLSLRCVPCLSWFPVALTSQVGQKLGGLKGPVWGEGGPAPVQPSGSPWHWSFHGAQVGFSFACVSAFVQLGTYGMASPRGAPVGPVLLAVYWGAPSRDPGLEERQSEGDKETALHGLSCFVHHGCDCGLPCR